MSVHIAHTLLYAWFLGDRVANHQTEGDCFCSFFYSSHSRKLYFALISCLCGNETFIALSDSTVYTHLKYKAKTPQVQQFQTLILIRDLSNESSISVHSSSEKRDSFEQFTSEGFFCTHAKCFVSLISFGK